MRIWIIISSIIVLVFSLPGLLLSLLSGDWGGLAVCALLSALAVHSFYYLRVARSQPERGYLQLATGQILFGVIVAALLVKMALVINNPASWETAKTLIQEQLQQLQLGMSHSDIQWFMQDMEHAYHLIKPAAIGIVLAGAVLSIASQGAFAWLLLRKRNQPQAGIGASAQTDAEATGRHGRRPE